MLEPDPDCPSTSRHRSIRAHREAHCTCGKTTGGESWARWQAYRQRRNETPPTDRDRQRWRDQWHLRQEARGRGRRHYPAPEDFVGTVEHRRLLERPDLACREADPTLFEIEGQETSYLNRQRIVAARAICASCPALDQCREVALRDVDDRDTFRGGMSPGEREQWRIQFGVPRCAA